jgi:DNA ligase-1
VNTDNAKLALFDILPLEDFHKGKCAMSQTVRHKLLVGQMANFQELTGERVYVVPKRIVDLDVPAGYNEYLEFNKEAIEAGFEGIMLKDPEAPYECKRATHWLKQKPFIEVTLEIVGFNPGEPDTKYSNTLGALVCHGFSDDGREIDVKVSGIDDAMRDELWTNREKYMGFLVEVRADALTKERNSETWSLRFPRFKGLRGTEPGEKI